MSEQQPSEDPLRTARRRRHAAALHPMHSPVRLQRPGHRTVWPDNGDFASTDQCFLHGTGADVATVSSRWLYGLPQPRPHLWHYFFRHRYQLAPIGAAAPFSDLMVSRNVADLIVMAHAFAELRDGVVAPARKRFQMWAQFRSNPLGLIPSGVTHSVDNTSNHRSLLGVYFVLSAFFHPPSIK